MLVELGEYRDSAFGDTVEGGLPDMSGEPKCDGGHPHKTFCHMQKIPAIYDYQGQTRRLLSVPALRGGQAALAGRAPRAPARNRFSPLGAG